MIIGDREKRMIWLDSAEICLDTGYILWPEKYMGSERIHPTVYLSIKLIKASMHSTNNVYCVFIQIRRNPLNSELALEFVSKGFIHRTIRIHFFVEVRIDDNSLNTLTKMIHPITISREARIFGNRLEKCLNFLSKDLDNNWILEKSRIFLCYCIEKGWDITRSISELEIKYFSEFFLIFEYIFWRESYVELFFFFFSILNNSFFFGFQ